MIGYPSGQDLPPSRLPTVSRKKRCPESHIINPLLTKFNWSRWLDIGLVFFFSEFMDLDFISVHKHAKKEVDHNATILASHLVKNAYFQNGYHFSVSLFTCKLALVASFLNSKFKRIFSLSEATRAYLQVNKRILKWWPFWNKVYAQAMLKKCLRKVEAVLSNQCTTRPISR